LDEQYSNFSGHFADINFERVSKIIVKVSVCQSSELYFYDLEH